MTNAIERKISFLLLIYLFIVLGYIFSSGFYFLPGLIVLLISFSLLLCFSNDKFTRFVTSISFAPLSFFTLALFVILSNIMYGGIYQRDLYGLILASRALLAIAMPLSLLYIFDFSKFIPIIFKYKFWLLIFIALCVRVLMVLSSPAPYIDVYVIQKIAPLAILKGQNPYSMIFPQLYKNEISDVYSYGPGVIFLDSPAVLLAKEPRYTMVFAEIGTAILVYIILGSSFGKLRVDKSLQEMLPLIFLYNPRAGFIIEQAWVDPLIIFLITLFSILLFVWRKRFLALIVLGIAIASKQYVIFLLPFLVIGRLIKIKELFITFFVLLFISSPFLIWNFKDFFRDVILYNLVIQTSRYNSLSLNTLYHLLLGSDIPRWLVIIFELGVLYYLIKVQRKLSASSLMLATSTLAISTFLVYRLAFIHYYYFAGSLLLLSICFAIGESSGGFKRPTHGAR